MLKRLTVAFTLAAFLLSPGLAKDGQANNLPVVKDNRIQVLVPGTQRHMPMNLVKKAIGSQDGLEINRVKMDAPREAIGISRTLEDEVLWNLTHADDNAEYYLGSGAAGDTFAVVFTPAVPCIVKEVYHQWNSAGNAIAFGAKYGPASALSADGQCQSILRGSTNLSPIGQLMTTPTLNTIDAAVSAYTLQLDIGGTFIVGDSTDLTSVEPFVIVFVKGGVDPYPLADATDDQGGITYTWFGGPWNAGQTGLWGRYSNVIENMCLVKVAYPWGAPIAIYSLDLLPNTYATDHTFTVLTDLFDDVDDVTNMAIDENDVIKYHYVFQGDTSSGAVAEHLVGFQGNGLYKFDIVLAGGKAGDEIEYWITAVDDDALVSESVHLSFEIVQPSYPYAKLLLIADSPSDEQAGADLYRTVLDDNDIVYEFWDASVMQGIDSSVINQGWSNIIVYGWGSKTVPMDATDDDPGYGFFLDGGGNLLLVDQDWFLSHTSDAVVSFAAGDFAYDYFGIGSGDNDPRTSEDVSLGDTSATGYDVTTIDIPFVVDPLILDHYIYGTSNEDFDANWADYLNAGAGTPIFLGEQSGQDVGIANATEAFKAVFLAFMADAAVDTTEAGLLDYTQFAALLEGALDYFGVTSPPLISKATTYKATAAAGPYAVSATIVDADAEVVTAALFYSSDTAKTWESVAMTAVVDTFSAELPLLAAAEWYYYFIKATDAAADTSVYPDANTPTLSFYYWVPTEGTDVLFVDDMSGYGSYYYDFYDVAFTTNSVAYDYYEIDDFGVPDTTVFRLANYSNIVWSAELTGGDAFEWETAANPLAKFIEEGGGLMLTGDEALGFGYGWPGLLEPFSAGDVAMDWFGLSTAWSDGPAADSVVGVADDPITGTWSSDSVFYEPSVSIVVEWTDALVIGDITLADSTVAVETTETVDTIYTTAGDTVITTTTILDSAWTYINDQSAWFATRYSGDHNAIFLALNFSWFDAATQAELLDNSLAWLDSATVAGVSGIFGPEWTSFKDDGPEVSDTTVVRDTLFVPPVGIAAEGAELPTKFAVKSNYPNPFNPSTIISFDIAAADHVTLRIYNLLGQEVAALHDVFTVPGSYRVVWNATNAAGQKLPSGLYFYRVVSGKNSGTGKMVLLQ